MGIGETVVAGSERVGALAWILIGKLRNFDGCPSYALALQNLHEVIAEHCVLAEIEMVRIESVEEGAAQGFLGAPTIQINGKDLEGPIALGGGPGLGCRVYRDGGAVRGWPSKDSIRSALEGLSIRPSVTPKGSYSA